MATQLNVRLPQPTIDRTNQLAKIYGSQAKVIIVAIELLHTKEFEMNINTALTKVGEMKFTDDSTTFTDDGNNWTDRRPNGTVYYQFTDDEISAANASDPQLGAEYSTYLPWDNAHVTEIRDSDDETIWER